MPPLRVTAKELRRLLELDGWMQSGWRTHGLAFTKQFPGRTRVTIIPKRGTLAPGTLSAILSDKQTGLGRDGLNELLRKHGR